MRIIAENASSVDDFEAEEAAQAEKEDKILSDREHDKALVGKLKTELLNSFFLNVIPDFGDVDKVGVIAEYLFKTFGVRDFESASRILKRLLGKSRPNRLSDVDRALAAIMQQVEQP